MSTPDATPGGEVLVYEAADGSARVDVRLDRGTVWLTQDQMARLFGRERSVVTKHIRNAFREGGAGGAGNPCKICTGSGGRRAHRHPRGRTLQPRRHHFCRLPGQIRRGYPLSPMGRRSGGGSHKFALYLPFWT